MERSANVRSPYSRVMCGVNRDAVRRNPTFFIALPSNRWKVTSAASSPVRKYEGPHFALGTETHRTIQDDIERLRQNRGSSLLRALNHGARQTIVGADTVQRYVEKISRDATPAQSEFLT